MFNNKTRPHPEWRALYDRTLALPWGTMIAYQEIEAWMGLRRSDPRFRGNIQRWKKEMLREAQRPVIAVPTEGYRILQFEEIAPRAKHLVRLGVRGIRRGVNVAEHAPFDQMPEAPRRALTDLGVRMGMLAQLCREKLREFKVLSPPDGGTSPTPRVFKGSK